ncbi:hypothetical protein E1264_07160 [Actinomadura sp. KC216]|uniref:hypothetical protein n=1 Tax=Actinomadura sp. KC216 TaxID=2530370 RepID=UPI00104DF7FD|nr:hypothetical protein [Actinomadura sp. KC216]TDB89766.1 hypothetical protein E1264_07160 [Actinomadura sp. KC216]
MRRRRAYAALALLPVLALGPLGCGSEGTGAGSGGTAKAVSDQQKMRDFAKCMRDNGVDMDDPGGDGEITIRHSEPPGKAKGAGPKVDNEVDAAQKKCRHLMPNGGKPEKPKPEEIAKLRAYAKCMRDNGVSKFPDPKPDGSMLLKAGKGTGIDPQSPEFKDAQKACAKFQPERGRKAPPPIEGKD